MSDCNKEICDLYDLSVVMVDGVVLEKRFGTAFKQCQLKILWLRNKWMGIIKQGVANSSFKG